MSSRRIPPPHHFLDDVRDFGGGPRGPRAFPLPHPAAAAMIEERIGAQQQEIQGLLADNQMLAATHVALKQELASSRHDLHRMSHALGTAQAEGDLHLREIYENSLKMEAELRTADAMRTELIQIRGDIQKLNAARQELTGQFQVLTQDLSKATADVQKAPAIKYEIEQMKEELQQAKQAIEYEKKGYLDNYERGTVMEKNLIAIAREVEKLRSEVANAEKRARAAAAAGNQGSAVASYGGNYGNLDPSYGGNPYPAAYGINPVHPEPVQLSSALQQVPETTDGAPQSAAGAGPLLPHGSWGPYDMQRTQARR